MARKLIAILCAALALCAGSASAGYTPPGGGKMIIFGYTSATLSGTVNRVITPTSQGGELRDPATSVCSELSGIQFPIAGTIRNLRVTAMCTISAGSVTIGPAVFVSGCTTFQTTSAVQGTLSVGTGNVLDSTHSLAVGAGQSVNMNFAATSLTTSCGGFRWSFEFDPN